MQKIRKNPQELEIEEGLTQGTWRNDRRSTRKRRLYTKMG